MVTNARHQNLPPECSGFNRQSAALVVTEAYSSAAELLSKNAILLTKVINDLQLSLVHPAGDSDQQESEWICCKRARTDLLR